MEQPSTVCEMRLSPLCIEVIFAAANISMRWPLRRYESSLREQSVCVCVAWLLIARSISWYRSRSAAASRLVPTGYCPCRPLFSSPSLSLSFFASSHWPLRKVGGRTADEQPENGGTGTSSTSTKKTNPEESEPPQKESCKSRLADSFAWQPFLKPSAERRVLPAPQRGPESVRFIDESEIFGWCRLGVRPISSARHYRLRAQ